MSFKVFSFDPHLEAAIKKCGYSTPTPIQQQAMPSILGGCDLLGLAQTGTGKTAAFVLPTLQRLMQGSRGRVRALVIAPTRELAEQIHDYFLKMTAGTNLRSVVIYGGVSKSNQARRLREGVEIIVACPGRLLDHLQDKAVDLSHIEMLILDEADHMFDKGFLPDIRRILKQVPTKRQTLIFSATMPGEVRHLVEDILNRPVTVQIDYEKLAKSVSHSIYQVEQSGKTALLQELLCKPDLHNALVFTRTKHKARSLALSLEKSGFKAAALQGNMSQVKRQQALDGFKQGTFNILVATDIAARGIDVSGLSHVINFDMPDTVEAYTHRTGRTGRAACAGDAFTFATSDDNRIVQQIKRALGSDMPVKTIAGRPVKSSPSEVHSMKSKVEKAAPVASQGKQRRGRAKSFDFGL
jgi:superfamily II DNA/RNA helicase